MLEIKISIDSNISDDVIIESIEKQLQVWKQHRAIYDYQISKIEVN